MWICCIEQDKGALHKSEAGSTAAPVPRPRGKHFAADHATTCGLPRTVADDEGVVGCARVGRAPVNCPNGATSISPALERSDYADWRIKKSNYRNRAEGFLNSFASVAARFVWPVSQ